MQKVSYLSIIYKCCQLVIYDDLKVGGNNGIVEIYAANLHIASTKHGPLHEQISIAPKWSPNPLSTQLFDEANKYKVPHMGKAKLARRGNIRLLNGRNK